MCDMGGVEKLRTFHTVKYLQANERVSFMDFQGYPHWPKTDTFYSDPVLLDWHRSLASIDYAAYDLVVSDNYVEILEYCEDAVLMGSFLWHDVYRSYIETDITEQYHQYCSDLLDRTRPYIIVNEYFAMPATLSSAQPVSVGMLPGAISFSGSEPGNAVLVLAGGARSNAGILAPFVQSLIDDGYHIFGDKGMLKEAGDAVQLFDFDRDDLSRMKCIIGRPGMGLITDCIAAKRPLVAVYEPNPEMEHNAQVLQKLGIGLDLGSSIRSNEAFDAVRRYIDDTPHDNAFESLDSNGLEQTVAFITTTIDS